MLDEKKSLVGKPAPDFALLAQDGQTETLSSYRGKWVFLYFYPTDDEERCAKEACAIRDHILEFARRGVVVLGVSKDSVAEHKQFVKKHDLPFLLLSDPQRKVLHQYHVFMDRGQYDTEAKSESVAFLINPIGEIERAFHNNDPKRLIDAVAKTVDAAHEEVKSDIKL